MKLTTKKRFLQVKLVFAMFLFVLLMTGCGSSEATEVTATATETSTTEEKTITAIETMVQEEVTEQNEEKKAPTRIIDNESIINLSIEPTSPYYKRDTTNIYSKSSDASKPYFIGRDNYEENIDYIDKNKGENDGFIYLGLPLYLPDYAPRGTTYVTVDDETIAKIEGNDLIGLKQGIFTLYCYDEKETLLEEKKIVCSTFNDSKENLESLMSIKTATKATMMAHINMNDAEYWKDNVHTIMDMSYMLQVREFKYDFDKEPRWGAIRNCMDEDCWTWTADPKTIFDMSGGVCIQVAQLACYMLAEDYEDWGVVLVEGTQGHIFNWFFEDGNYYIFDFTDVISENAWSRGSDDYMKYWDYSDRVKIFRTIDEIKEYIVTEKVETDKNYLVYMYSCKGHDFIACNLNTGMRDSTGVTEGKYEEVIIGYQDVVMEDLVVLYQNENSSDVVFKTFTTDQISDVVPCGVYNNNNVLNYRFKY